MPVFKGPFILPSATEFQKPERGPRILWAYRTASDFQFSSPVIGHLASQAVDEPCQGSHWLQESLPSRCLARSRGLGKSAGREGERKV